MATDGVTDLIEPVEVWEAVIHESDLTEPCIDCSAWLDRGGYDNLTMILIALP